MFNFIEKEVMDAKVSNQYIDDLEKKLGIKFPVILREYYLQHNGAEIKECRFVKYGLEFCVVMIYGLNYGTVPVEKILKYNSKNEAVPKSFIPLAVDEDEDDYYWDAKTGKVYYLSFENVEHPKEIFGSVEQFFSTLNKCSNGEAVIIETPNYENNIIDIVNNESDLYNDEFLVINESDVDKILKYNNNAILKVNLIFFVCAIISLIFIPITDGLSVILAGVFVCWILIFVVIDIINRTISSNVLKKYNFDEIKKELLDKKTRKIVGIDTYLTDNYIISNSKTIKITKYSDIVWTYPQRPNGTVAQQGGIGIAYKIGGTPVIAYLKNGKKVTIALVKNPEQLKRIFKKITSENNEVLIGETSENIKKYENLNNSFKIKNQISTIIVIICFLLTIVLVLYAHFIK